MKKLLFAALSLTLAGTASAQSSAYYILNGDSNIGYIVKNGSIQSTFALGDVRQYALEISGGNMVVSDRDGSKATQYNLTGVPTGNVFAHPAQSLDQLVDGGTDGTHTYAARCCSAADGIYRGDMTFGGLTLFAGAGTQFSGVTYGAGSVWGLTFGGALQQYSLAGALLNSYNLGFGRTPAALAFEASTNSLWFALNNSSDVYNFSLAGNQIAHLSVDGLGGNFFGGEMSFSGDVPNTTTPEPSTYVLMGAGLAGVAFARRRRRTA